MAITRERKLVYTTIASLVFQITTIITGFVLPRLILSSFGSEVNGLVNSILQFLHVIAFLELGVGAVVQSSLYKELASHDETAVSKILKSANKFFRQLAYILLVYVVVLFFLYPLFVSDSFGWIYTVTLIAAMCISSFAQYYFGVVDRLLLSADQRGYIQYTAQTLTLIANTIACAILIKCGASIHIVKLTSSLIYLLRPVFLRLYVNRHYNIDRKIKYDTEPIKQKWNGVAQHIAAVVLDGTDSIILTIFATLSDVSIYYVYHLVVYGIKALFTTTASGISAFLGNLWAKQETEELQKAFNWVEWIYHTGTTFIFGCAGVLIIPFVRVYTDGISDANYIQPLFAVLIVMAHAFHCYRLPYNSMILAGGHYKQTQRNYIVAALLNIIISIGTVKLWGLIGVAIGTLVAMVYQTIWMAFYDSKNFLNRSMWIFVKHIMVDIISVAIAVALTFNFTLHDIGYLNWIILALKVASIWLVVILLVNCVFYKDMVKKLLNTLLKRVGHGDR